MSWASLIADALRELVGWSKEAREVRQAEHAQAVAAKADIDRRHVERRDLSKDKRPR